MNRVDLFLMRFSANDSDSKIVDKLKKLIEIVKVEKVVNENDLTAIKTHFGEEGNTTHLPAFYLRPIIESIKHKGARPFVTDSNVLYKSKRDNAVSHILLAQEHGFSLESLGAPVIIADGISGRNEITVEINAPINKSVALASEFITADSLVVVTHVTGHMVTGLGATIKNIGMGMASRKGKLIQHSVSMPEIISSKCEYCGVCQEWCPADAIIKKDKFYYIDDSKCIGCGECLTVCRKGAVNFRWDNTSSDLQKQMAEHALGIVKHKEGKIIYFTFLINMTKDCDCLKQKETFLLDDIGVIAGSDPVAIDKAVLDLTSANNKNIATLSYPRLNPFVQLEYGEKIGLGTRDYQLIECS